MGESQDDTPYTERFNDLDTRFKHYCAAFATENSFGKTVLPMDELGVKLYKEYLTTAIDHLNALPFFSEETRATVVAVSDLVANTDAMIDDAARAACLGRVQTLSGIMSSFMRDYSIVR